MGLRDKAERFRKNKGRGSIDSLIGDYSNKTLKSGELEDLKREFESRLAEVAGQLDRRLMDMKTLFEIGKEINATLSVNDLLEIVAFTIIGQYHTQDVAIFIYHNNVWKLANRKGFPTLDVIQFSGGFTGALGAKNEALAVSDLVTFREEYAYFGRIGAKLAVPMMGKNELVGVIIAGARTEEQPYNDEEKGMIYTLASLSAVAFENARLYEELKAAYSRLDKKLNELSTLYEVSRVINSSEEGELVLSLVSETITTGFGVRSAAFIIHDRGRYTVRKTVGMADSALNSEVVLSSFEQKMVADNRVGVLPVNQALRETAKASADKCLFVPLVCVGKTAGVLVIFSFANYDISEKDQELLNLFSIIASQAAPPLMVSSLVQSEKESVKDPFSPVLQLIGDEIEKARNFGVTVTFAMLRLNNFRKYCELFPGAAGFQKLDGLVAQLNRAIVPSKTIMRYSSSRVLFVFPAMPDSDFQDVRELILSTSKGAFGSEKEIDAGIDLLHAVYPDNGDNKYSILSLIE